MKKRIPIAINLATATGGTTPVHATLGLPPAFWDKEPADVALMILADDATEADISAVTSAVLVISERPGHDSPLLTKTVADTEFSVAAIIADFEAGTDQHVLFEIAVDEMHAFLGGDASRTLYAAIMVEYSTTWACLANGPITLHAAPAAP